MYTANLHILPDTWTTTLLHRAATLPNRNEGKQLERKHVTNTLISNGYPKKFIQQVESNRAKRQNRTPPPEELVRMFCDVVEPKSNYNYAVLPYIKGLNPMTSESPQNLLAHLNKCSLLSKTDHCQKTRPM